MAVGPTDEQTMFSEYFFVTLTMNDIRKQFAQSFITPLNYLLGLFNDEDGFELVRSGSSIEHTMFPTFYLKTEEQKIAARSDFDKMNVLKYCYAGEINETQLFNQLVIDSLKSPLLDTSIRFWSITYNDCFVYGSNPVTTTLLPRTAHFTTVFQIETEGCHPGFARLVFNDQLLCQMDFHTENNILWFLYKKAVNQFNNKNYLSVHLCRQIHEKTISMYGHSTNNHGPANQINYSILGFKNIAAVDVETDNVLAIRSQYIPKEALNMIKRKSKSGFPTSKMKGDILLKGCLLVPLASKTSENEEFEWRFSFSESETMLCSVWNQTQRFSYILLKLLKFRYLNDLISSYHFKTAIFWCIEIFDIEMWKRENLLICVAKVLLYVINMLKKRSIPNYFIESNNMVAHYTNEQFAELIDKMMDVHDNLHDRMDEFVSGYVYSKLNRVKMNNVLQVMWLEWRRTKFDECWYTKDLSHLVWANLVLTELHLFNMFEQYASNDENLSFFKASLAHRFLCLYMRTGSVECMNLSHRLFSTKLSTDPKLSIIQLSLFYFVTNSYDIALQTLTSIEQSKRVLNLENFQNNVLDIIMTTKEMTTYNLFKQQKSLSEDHRHVFQPVWQFNQQIFASFIEIMCLFKLNHTDRVKEELEKYQFCLATMMLAKIERVYVDSAMVLHRVIISELNPI